MLVAAVEHGSGLVLGQLEIASKTNEIPAVRDLADAVAISGRAATVDALHAQHAMARHLLDECRADYVVTAIKDNQPTMLADLQGMDFSDSPACETLASVLEDLFSEPIPVGLQHTDMVRLGRPIDAHVELFLMHVLLLLANV